MVNKRGEEGDRERSHPTRKHVGNVVLLSKTSGKVEFVYNLSLIWVLKTDEFIFFCKHKCFFYEWNSWFAGLYSLSQVLLPNIFFFKDVTRWHQYSGWLYQLTSSNLLPLCFLTIWQQQAPALSRGSGPSTDLEADLNSRLWAGLCGLFRGLSLPRQAADGLAPVRRSVRIWCGAPQPPVRAGLLKNPLGPSTVQLVPRVWRRRWLHCLVHTDPQTDRHWPVCCVMQAAAKYKNKNKTKPSRHK